MTLDETRAGAQDTDAGWGAALSRGDAAFLRERKRLIGRVYASLCDQMIHFERSALLDISLHPALSFVNSWLCGFGANRDALEQGRDTALGAALRLGDMVIHGSTQTPAWHGRAAGREVALGVVQLCTAVLQVTSTPVNIESAARATEAARGHARQAAIYAAAGNWLPDRPPATAPLPWWARLTRWVVSSCPDWRWGR